MTLLFAALTTYTLAGLGTIQGPTPDEIRWLESIARAATPDERAMIAQKAPERLKPTSLIRLASSLRKASVKERQAWSEAGRGLLLLTEAGANAEVQAHASWANARLASSPQTKNLAVRFYQQAADRFSESGNPLSAECLLESGELDVRYGGMIEQMTAQARLQRCREAFHAQGRPDREIRCLIGISEADVYLGNIVAADRSLQAAAAMAQGLTETEVTAKIDYVRALIARERRQFPTCLLALADAKAAFAKERDDDGLALCHEVAAWVYSALGEREKQYDELRRYIELRERIGEPWGIAEGKAGLADFWADVGRRDDSAEAIFEAASIYRRIGATLQEAHCNLVGGENFALNGRFGEAFLYLERARSVLEDRKDLVGLSRYHLAMGTLLAEVGRPRDAIEMYQKAIPYFRQIRAKRNEAVAYLNAAVSLRQLREYDRARTCLDRALTLFDELGDVSDRALTLLNLGQLDMNRGEFERAQAHLTEARRLFVAVQNPQKVASCDLALGSLAFRSNDLSEAKEFLERADRVLIEVGDRSRGTYSAALLGRVAQAEGRSADAITQFERAMTRLESLRSSIGDPEIAAGAAEGLSRLTPDLAMAYLSAGKPESAFAAAQRGKGALLRQALLGTRLQPKPTDEKDRNEVRRLQLAYDLSSGPNKERRLAELDAYLAQVRSRKPIFGKLDARPATLEAISKALPSDTAIVEYVVGPSEAAALILKGGKTPRVEARRLSTTASEVQTLVEGILAADRDFDVWSSRLHRLLVEPIAPSLTGVKTVVICPDGSLHSVPFASLKNVKGRYLIEDFAVVIAPSASAWEACRTVASRPRDRSKPGLLVARSEFTAGGRSAEAFRGPSALPDLPWIKEEAGAIKRLLGSKVIELAEQKATVPAFRQKAGSAPLLHFATHALPNAASPMLGCLALAPTPEGDPGLLYARDIYEMKLDAELAVLSACSTAQGRALAGEGLLGLGWAFLVAGCPSTLATRWDLGDRSGRVWVEAFYRHRASGMTISSAYQAACIDSIRGKSTASPRQWGAWVLIGAG
ncbi:MAG TPA: CHAT domain-containing protein [Fimbriimonadaceae bacterium]|mgnify:CR=1 FL=1|nr:CHAT domain-containing protein [Fimbriimonadaceae bacterium]